LRPLEPNTLAGFCANIRRVPGGFVCLTIIGQLCELAMLVAHQWVLVRWYFQNWCCQCLASMISTLSARSSQAWVTWPWDWSHSLRSHIHSRIAFWDSLFPHHSFAHSPWVQHVFQHLGDHQHNWRVFCRMPRHLWAVGPNTRGMAELRLDQLHRSQLHCAFLQQLPSSSGFLLWQ
jgi:hypothetical protein